MTLKVQELDHLVVQVSDVDGSAKWYGRVLGMIRGDVSPEAWQAAAGRDAVRSSENKLKADRCEQRGGVHG
jgi:hypothetical protein